MDKINVLNKEIAFYTQNEEDYVCITDIARYKDERTDDIIKNWLRNRNTIEFLGIWEKINNLNFNPVEFDGFRKKAGLNSFILTAKQWIEKTNAIGIISKSGRYGGTYAHQEYGIEFWFARDLQILLGYVEWRKFTGAIEKAKESCKNTGNLVSDHFVGAAKTIDMPKGATKEIED